MSLTFRVTQEELVTHLQALAAKAQKDLVFYTTKRDEAVANEAAAITKPRPEKCDVFTPASVRYAEEMRRAEMDITHWTFLATHVPRHDQLLTIEELQAVQILNPWRNR